MNSNPGSLYIHFPFCRKKCSYCSFYSISDLHLIEEYLDALIIDIKSLGEKYNTKLKTLYFGGGNPALIPPQYIARIFEEIRAAFGENIEEITFELNPEDVNRTMAEILFACGVNRISMGVQSFDNESLFVLGRASREDDVVRSLKTLRDTGFKNINLDLIYGAPAYNLDKLRRDLDRMIELKPQHISTYMLSLEEGTVLKKQIDNGTYSLPDDDEVADMLDLIIDTLEKAGFIRYEISNYAKPSFESKHNLAYWNYCDTLGAGAGAVYTNNGIRVENISDVKTYINMVKSGVLPYGEVEPISEEDRRIEYIIMNLRKKEGINKALYNERFGSDFTRDYETWMNKYVNSGKLIDDGNNIYFSKGGMNISSAVLCEIV